MFEADQDTLFMHRFSNHWNETTTKKSMKISEGQKKFYLVCHAEPNKLLVFDLLSIVAVQYD
jgi:hypothetical protein